MDDMYFYDTLPSCGNLTLEEMIENDIKMERVSASDEDDDDCRSLINGHHHHHVHHIHRPSSGLFDSDADFRLDFDGVSGLLVNPCTGLPSGLDPNDADDFGGSDGAADFLNGEYQPPPQLVKVKSSTMNNNNNIGVKRKTPPKSAPANRKRICDRRISRPTNSYPNGGGGNDRYSMTSSESEEESSDDEEEEEEVDIDDMVSMAKRTATWVVEGERSLRFCSPNDSVRRRLPQPLSSSSYGEEEQDDDDEEDERGDDDEVEDVVSSGPVAAATAAITTVVGRGTPLHPIQRIFAKPAFSYSCLIAIALKNSATGCLPVSEIYSFMIETFPFFKTAPNGWKNSVRHNLSLNKCFAKIDNMGPNNGNNQRKGCLWALNPDKVLKMDDEVQKWSRKNPTSIRNSMARPETFELLARGRFKSRDFSMDVDARKVILEPTKVTPVEQMSVTKMIKSELDVLDDGDENDEQEDDDDDDVDIDSASESDCDSFRNPDLWRELVDKMDFELPTNEYLISPERCRDVSASGSAAAAEKKVTSPETPTRTNGYGIKVSSPRSLSVAKQIVSHRGRVA